MYRNKRKNTLKFLIKNNISMILLFQRNVLLNDYYLFYYILGLSYIIDTCKISHIQKKQEIQIEIKFSNEDINFFETEIKKLELLFFSNIDKFQKLTCFVPSENLNPLVDKFIDY